MKSNHSFSVNFFIRRNREAFGRAPIYVKITVDGSRVFIPIRQTVEVAQWNQKAQKLKGNSPENNSARDRMRQTLYEINFAYDKLRFQKDVVTAEKIKIEGGDQGKTLKDLIKYHFDQPGKLLAPGTLKN